MWSEMIFKGKGFFFVAVMLVTACASPLKQIKDPTVPFERPSYSILPPEGKGWSYIKREKVGAFELTFFKTNPPTHSVAVLIVEKHSFAEFNTSEEFLRFVKKAKALGTDPRRFKRIRNEITLDNKFGDYSVKSYSSMQDSKSSNIGENDYLVLNLYGYTFIHPLFKNIMIDISYSERGTENEIDPNFENTAKKFLRGLILKEDKQAQELNR